MMKMSGRVTSCCVALIFVLTSVSAVQQLDSINDLKRIDFGQSVPKHSLLLLHWFANEITIDYNDIITLAFDPNSGDYGSHHYGNYERLLDPLPGGYRYYTVGNINQETSMPLPDYVVYPRTEYMGRNMDRIIIRAREEYTEWQVMQRIDQVYLTQHYEASDNQGTRYDPAHTYRITADLLREIGEFSDRENTQSPENLRDDYGSDADVSHIRNTWGDLAALGLLLFIVIQERSSTNQRNNRPKNRRSHLDDSPSESNDSRDSLIQENFGMVIPDNEDRSARRMTVNRGSGSYNTSGNCHKCVFCGICIVIVIVAIIILGVILGLKNKTT